jgi:hypothetical protein
VELRRGLANVSVQGKLRPRGICRSYAAAVDRAHPRDRGPAALRVPSLPYLLQPAVWHMQRALHSKPGWSRRFTTPSCLSPPPPRRHSTRSSPLPASAMLKAQVLRRHFSLFNRVPYSQIARSVARDGHESVTIHRIRIGRPVFSRS